MTAIEKMVEWLETKHFLGCGADSMDEGYKAAMGDALDYARRLAAEEAKEHDNRPTVTCREADLADWHEHKEAFKEWFEAKEKPTGDSTTFEVVMRNGNLPPGVEPVEVREAKEKPVAPARLVEEIREWYFGGIKKLSCKKWEDDLFNILSRYRPSPQADIVGELRELANIIVKTKDSGDLRIAIAIEKIIAKFEGEK